LCRQPRSASRQTGPIQRRDESNGRGSPWPTSARLPSRCPRLLAPPRRIREKGWPECARTGGTLPLGRCRRLHWPALPRPPRRHGVAVRLPVGFQARVGSTSCDPHPRRPAIAGPPQAGRRTHDRHAAAVCTTRSINEKTISAASALRRGCAGEPRRLSKLIARGSVTNSGRDYGFALRNTSTGTICLYLRRADCLYLRRADVLAAQ
jgi:hypothetical protein